MTPGSRACYHSLARSLCVALTLTSAARSNANDSVFRGDSASLTPLEENRVRMLSEDITLSAHYSAMSWDIAAVYVFENQASAPVTLQVGFPELRCMPSDDDWPPPDLVEKRCADLAFRNLKTLVDGQPVSQRKGALDEHHTWRDYIGVIWLFDVTFPPKKQVTITHSYTMGSSFDSVWDRLTTYVTRTGVGWAGSIGRARFTARLPPFTNWVETVSAQGLEAHPPRVTANGEVEVVVEGTDWTPAGDVHFSFNTTYYRMDPKSAERCNFLATGPLEAQAAQECINLLYASKGYPFRSAELRQRFYAGSHEFQEDATGWSRSPHPIERFDPSWFSEYETQSLKRWTQWAKQGGGSQGDAATAEVLPGPPAESLSATTGNAKAAPPATPRLDAAASASALAASSGKPATSPAPSSKVAGARTAAGAMPAKGRSGCQWAGAPQSPRWFSLGLLMIGCGLWLGRRAPRLVTLPAPRASSQTSLRQ